MAAANSPFGGSKGPKDRLINMQVAVVKGEFKGYLGTVKDTNGNTARVELATNRKVISIDKSKLRRKKWVFIISFRSKRSNVCVASPYTGTLEEIESAFNNMPPPSGYSTSSGWSPRSSPAPNRTPNPYLASDGGRTPGQGISGRTPNPYQMAGGRTPGWAPTAPTPNPFASGGRTPGRNSGVTTNPYLGGRTPARTDAGQWGADPQWGASSPAYKSPAWVIYIYSLCEPHTIITL